MWDYPREFDYFNKPEWIGFISEDKYEFNLNEITNPFS